MAGPGPTLREVHRLRRHIKDLQDQMERLPRQLQTSQAKVTFQEEALRQVQEAIKRLKVTTLQKESEFKTKIQDSSKHQKQLNTAESKKEYEALQAEILQEKKESHAAMEETEQRTAQLPDSEKALKQAKAEAAETEKSMTSRRASITEQLDQASRQLKETEATLPEDIRAQYERQITARGEDALAAVDGRTCRACYTEITAQTTNQLLMGQFVLCKSCGRILYLPE
jgi:predicted  nucleic acid-binding Zn-ribbon protein